MSVFDFVTTFLRRHEPDGKFNNRLKNDILNNENTISKIELVIKSSKHFDICKDISCNTKSLKINRMLVYTKQKGKR